MEGAGSAGGIDPGFGEREEDVEDLKTNNNKKRAVKTSALI